MNSQTLDTPLLTNAEAMAFFRIKDPRVWRRYQLLHKIPFGVIGSRKMFYRDILEKIAIKAQEATARKVYL